MDTLEQYIKMCDNKKIQASLPKEGDFYICFIQHGKYYIQMQPRKKIIKHPGRYRQIKLPMQDQIQEMLIMDYDNAYTLEDCFHEYCSKRVINYWIDASVEQLWLAFYMWEKHGKVWNGKKWVKKE